MKKVKTGTAVGKTKMGPIKVMPHHAQKYEVKIEEPDIIVTIPRNGMIDGTEVNCYETECSKHA